MKPELFITLIQKSLDWENKEQNLANFTQLLQTFDSPSDIILLPEMFTTGFSMNSEKLAETMDGAAVEWMQNTAQKMNTVIAGSLIIKEGNHFFNRFIWASPDGRLQHYDKRHLFRMANEHEHYTQGDKRLIIEYKGWRICPQICYDLRFPVWSRNRNDYDVLLYVANWPEVRRSAWQSLLPARAIENLCYTIGVNRVGTDGKGISYAGDSAAFDFKGEKLSQIHPFQESAETTVLSMKDLIDYRTKFPAFMDADTFDITM